WISKRSARFRFNRRVSRDYLLERGVPQGFTLSLFLFTVYIGDVMKPRFRSGPSFGKLVMSYVDNGVIVVAGESKVKVKWVMEETYGCCKEVAGKRGMGFGSAKTEWMGFGKKDWEKVDIGGMEVEEIKEIRILGYRFEKEGGWKSHVDCWADRGEGVIRRINGLS
ncbi:hypothetical protein C7212DRAFT_60401, partial [Tuber magnatum]